MAAVVLHRAVMSESGVTRASAALVLVPTFLLSLILVNAQSVTASTSERDLNALYLAVGNRFVRSGVYLRQARRVLYNSKEMIVLPLAVLCVYLWWAGTLSARPWLLARWHAGAQRLRRYARSALRTTLRKLSQCKYRRQPGHGIFSLRRRSHVHAADGGLQRVVSGTVPAIPGRHWRRQASACM